jgi:hypothetical protein
VVATRKKSGCSRTFELQFISILDRRKEEEKDGSRIQESGDRSQKSGTPYRRDGVCKTGVLARCRLNRVPQRPPREEPARSQEPGARIQNTRNSELRTRKWSLSVVSRHWNPELQTRNPELRTGSVSVSGQCCGRRQNSGVRIHNSEPETRLANGYPQQR